MLALSLDAAKHIAIVVVVVLVVFALVSAAAIKSVVMKLVSVLVLAGLALGVWTQRSNLEDCAQRVKDRGVADTDRRRSQRREHGGVCRVVPGERAHFHSHGGLGRSDAVTRRESHQVGVPEGHDPRRLEGGTRPDRAGPRRPV